MLSQIRELLDIITKSVSALETACEGNGTQIPDLREPFAPPSEAFRADPIAAEAANVISAAALQLEAILTPPHVSLYRIVTGVRAALTSLCSLIEHRLFKCSISNPPPFASAWSLTSPKSFGKPVPRLVI